MKCDGCIKERKNVHMTCIEFLGKPVKLNLCERCYEKTEKTYKEKSNGKL